MNLLDIGMIFKSKINILFVCISIFLPIFLNAQEAPLVMHAISDFPALELDGFAPASKKGGRKVLSVNAAKYKDVFAAARGNFKGKSGLYNIIINTLKEFDGESTYRILIDNKLVATYQNPRTDKSGDFKAAGTTFKGIYVRKGSEIQVEFNSHTNGLIPENGGTAYARGRWSSLIFAPHNSDK